MQASSFTIPEEPNEDASEVKQSRIHNCRPDLSKKLQGQLHKTRMCAYWAKGTCNHGDDCAFAHTESEIQVMPNLSKTRMCEAFQQGKCTDSNCTFAHNEEELRPTELFHKTQMCKWAKTGKCRNGPKCRFAHSRNELKKLDTPDNMSEIFPDDSVSDVSTVAKTKKKNESVEEPMKVMFPSGGKINPVPLAPPPGLVAEPQQNIEFLQATVSTLMMQCNQLQKQVQAMTTEPGKTPLKAAAKPFVPLNSDAKPFVPDLNAKLFVPDPNAKTFVPATPDQKKMTFFQ
jgi:hypothetical protein